MRVTRWAGSTLLCVAAMALVLASCGGGGSDAASEPSKSTTTTAAPGSAKIASFDVPSQASCDGKPNVTTHVQYSVAGAASVKLLVDGGAALGADGAPLTTSPPSGDLQVAVHCDPLPHTFVIVAVDGSGHQTVKQVRVTTKL